MVGIALILNPTKKQNYFKLALVWKNSWVDSVLEQFYSAFDYYKTLVNDTNTVGNTNKSASTTNGSIDDATDEFENYMKRKFNAMDSNVTFEEEYARYLPIVNVGILMLHYLNLELMFWHSGRLTHLIILFYPQWLRII